MHDSEKKDELAKQITAAINEETLTEDTPALQRFKQLFPRSASPYIYLGIACENKRDFGRAFENYWKAEELLVEFCEELPGSIDLWVRLRDQLVGNALRYHQTHRTSPDRTRLIMELVTNGYEDGILYWALGADAFCNDEFAKAKEWFDKALGAELPLENLVADAHILRGISNIRLNRFQDGESDLKKVIAVGGKKAELAREFLAGVYEGQSDYEKSLEQIFDQDFRVISEEFEI